MSKIRILLPYPSILGTTQPIHGQLPHTKPRATEKQRVTAAKVKSMAEASAREENRVSKAARKLKKRELVERERQKREAEAQQIMAQKKTAQREEREKRDRDKKIAKERKADRKKQKQDEKARGMHMGGVAWGFDPTAGIIGSQTTQSPDSGCYIFGAKVESATKAGVDERDDLGRRTGRRWQKGNIWGVEYGGPGKEGHYGHGALLGRDPSSSKGNPNGGNVRARAFWRQTSQTEAGEATVDAA